MVIKYLKKHLSGGLEVPLDIVHEYTYLGTRISSTGNFNVSLNTWKRKPFTLFIQALVD